MSRVDQLVKLAKDSKEVKKERAKAVGIAAAGGATYIGGAEYLQNTPDVVNKVNEVARKSGRAAQTINRMRKGGANATHDSFIPKGSYNAKGRTSKNLKNANAAAKSIVQKAMNKRRLAAAKGAGVGAAVTGGLTYGLTKTKSWREATQQELDKSKKK